MFNFDGDFRRRPQQNLGGASQKSDRLTIIRKAQQERQKREDARRQQNGATVIQSSVRSFVQRQTVKRRERDRFDEYRRTCGVRNLRDLEYLVKRIEFFYHLRKDGERLVSIRRRRVTTSFIILSLKIRAGSESHFRALVTIFNGKVSKLSFLA